MLIIGLFSLFFGAICFHWPLTSSERLILWQLRLPRVLLGGLVGGALALSGAVLQALFLNPLAEPYILGISGGAALGGILALLFGINLFGLGITLGAFLGALLALAILFLLIDIKGKLDTYFLLLAGVVLNAFFSAIILFIFALIRAETLQSIYFWLLGNLSTVGFKEVSLLAIFVFGCGLGCFYYAHSLDALTQGEITASALGVCVERVKRHLLVFISLLIGATVAVSGMIGFVGLVIPHIIRLMISPKNCLLLPFSFMGGATFLILSDALARKIFSPLEMPVGVMTALIGAPFFLYLLRNYVKTR
jgi:iron complex transport system permease protein